MLVFIPDGVNLKVESLAKIITSIDKNKSAALINNFLFLLIREYIRVIKIVDLVREPTKYILAVILEYLLLLIRNINKPISPNK